MLVCSCLICCADCFVFNVCFVAGLGCVLRLHCDCVRLVCRYWFNSVDLLLCVVNVGLG